MASDRTRPGIEVKSESPGPRPTGPMKSRSARAREGRAARPGWAASTPELAAQPASSFPASVYSTIVLLSTPPILPPRLTSDFPCPSQLLPFFNLYSLPMARLWRFGFLFCSSISSVSRASVLRHLCQPLPLTWSSLDRRFLSPRLIVLRSPLSLPSRHPLF